MIGQVMTNDGGASPIMAMAIKTRAMLLREASQASEGETMERQIPGPLWIAIISLGLMVLGKVIAALIVSPLILIDAGLSGILLVGLIKGRRWAYVLTFISVVIGTILGLGQSVQNGLTVLMLDCLVLVPVLVCTNYFFPNELVEA